MRFNAEARREYQRFATSSAAVWNGNFRELSASIMRMGTLAEDGRITLDVVKDEIERLQSSWQPEQSHGHLESLLTAEKLADLDLFDRLQLDAVIATCRSCATLAEAGRKLFAASRTRRRAVNDSDRLKKYLARFNLDWASIKPSASPKCRLGRESSRSRRTTATVAAPSSRSVGKPMARSSDQAASRYGRTISSDVINGRRPWK